MNRPFFTTAALLITAACTQEAPTAPAVLRLAPRSPAFDQVGNVTTVRRAAPPGQTCNSTSGESIDVDFYDARGVSLWHGDEYYIDDQLAAHGGSFTIPYVVRDSTPERVNVLGWHRDPPGVMPALQYKTGFVEKNFYYSDNGGYIDVAGNEGHVCRYTLTWTPNPAPAPAMLFISPRYDTLPPGITANYGAHLYASDGYTEVFTTAPTTWWTENPNVAYVVSTIPPSGPLGFPSAYVYMNSVGATLLYATRRGITGGAELHVQNGGGGDPNCPPAGC